mgnify:FL=1
MNLVNYLIENYGGEILVDNQWQIKGSKGNSYTVEWHPFHSHYSCGCKGYAFRKKCRHIKEVSDSFKNRKWND